MGRGFNLSFSPCSSLKNWTIKKDLTIFTIKDYDGENPIRNKPTKIKGKEVLESS